MPQLRLAEDDRRPPVSGRPLWTDGNQTFRLCREETGRRLRRTVMISPTKGSSVVIVALALGYFAGSSALGAPSAAANDQVDLALVIAVDVSRSMDNDEQQVARQGYVDAFLSADVLQAILEGATKRIAVTYME